MKLVTILALVPFAAAVPAAQLARRDSGAFTVNASLPGTAIHKLPVQARALHFWLGGLPATYCPLQGPLKSSCPPGSVTAFAGPYTLDVEVPGGQQIYVNTTGALSFTQAHSASIPAGAAIGPFEYEQSQGPDGVFKFEGKGFIACPDNNGELGSSWQVFADWPNATVPTGDIYDCLPFVALGKPYGPVNKTVAAAWQYI